MTAEQKAEVVATKVMGRVSRPHSWCNADDAVVGYKDGQMAYRPTENIAQAWEVQERIVELGLELEWAAMLITLSDISQVAPDRYDWALATATADQRCHAAVLAVEGEQK